MCLMPPDEFAELVIDTTGADLTVDQQRRLAEMVQRGYQSWDEFHRRFSDHQRTIRALNPGLATWEDLRGFLEEHTGAVEVDGFRALRFTRPDAEGLPVAAEVSVPVLKFGDGEHYIGQEHDGMPVAGPEGVAARPLGMNVKAVADSLRRFALSTSTTGAAHLRWQGGKPPSPTGTTLGVLVLVRQTLRSEEARWVEQGLTLHVYHVDESGGCGEWTGADRAAALRGLLGAVIRREPARTAPYRKSSFAARPSGCRTSASSLPKSANAVNATRSCHCSRRSS